MSLSTDSSLLVDNPKRSNVRKESMKTVSWWGEITRSDTPIRSADVTRNEITSTLVNYCNSVGNKDTLTIETDDTYSITCTPDTYIWGDRKWVLAKDIQSGDTIWTNGVPEDNAWRDYDTLKKLYIEENLTLKQVGDYLGVSEHTIRKWVRKFGLGKGTAGALYGVENPNYKGADITREGGYQRMNSVVDEYGLRQGVCKMCGVTTNLTHIHHLDHNPINNDPSNLIEICPQCHRVEHVGYTIKHMKRSEITEVYSSGVQMTYDLSTENGLFVSEGFIVLGV